jgi:hypothetical protein
MTLTFALRLKKRVHRAEQKGYHPERSEGQKIFESWETIALYPDSHRGKTTR